MAILNKKLKIKDSEGTTVDCNIYTTQAEAGDTTLQMKVNNESAYVTLGETNGYGATKGRVKINGETHAIMSKAGLPYTEQSWTEPGTYTFTVPAGVTRMRVAVCGGGGGFIFSYYGTHQAGDGESSDFGNLLTATGGSGAYVNHTNINTAQETLQAGTGGIPNGRAGTKIFYQNAATSKGGAGFALDFLKKDGEYGEGGGCTGNSHSGSTVHAGGGSGGYNTGYVDVEPLETYQVIVGAGGTNSIKEGSTQKMASYKNAKSGFVLIAFGGDI